MKVRILNQQDSEITKDLFKTPNFMGANINEKDFFVAEKHVEFYHESFCCSYLSGLKNYKAIGYFNDDNNILGLISLYQSPDEPSWYGTQIRSIGGKQTVRMLLDHAIDLNEKDGRLKFYTLWSRKQTKYLRRFAFSNYNNARYDYFDEYFVPTKNKCFYTNHWHILFNRVLLPIDVVVRCTFLKQQYRNIIPIGGNI
jgi:hypothetical protein